MRYIGIGIDQTVPEMMLIYLPDKVSYETQVIPDDPV